MADPGTPARRLVLPAYHGAALRLGFLTLASAASEGVGLVMLVPILAIAVGGPTGGVGRVLADCGVPLRLDVLLAGFVALIALRTMIAYRRAIAATRFEALVVDSLRLRAWTALLHCDWRVLGGMRRAQTASLLLSRIDRAGFFVNQGIAALSAGVTLVAAGLAAQVISPRLALVAAAAGGIVLVALRGLRRQAGMLGEASGKAHAAAHGHIEEGLAALRVIKGLGAEQRSIDQFGEAFGALRRSMIDYQRALGRGQMALQTGGGATLAVLAWLALEHWRMPVSSVLPLIALFARVLPLLGVLQQSVLNCAHNRPAVSEALELVARTEAAHEGVAGPAEPPLFKVGLRLDQATVLFAGEKHPALDAISARIPARGVTVIVGPSGSGKSTLADIAGGLIEPDSGSASVDGVRLSGTARLAWRRRVSYVQQDPVLLSATLRENLLWADPGASDDRLTAALGEASADFALTLPLGLDTPLGDGGRQLSGGERQRLMLARALLRDPALLILDEATSALDAANEAQIAAAIKRLGRRMAVVVISHRGALLALADQTISLEHGRIAPNGDRAGATGDES